MTTTQRKYLLYCIGLICTVLALWQWALIPAQTYKNELRQKQTQARQRLQELQQLGASLEQLKGRARNQAQTGRKSQGFTLFSFLEQMATQDRVKESVEYMRPLSEQQEGRTLEKVQMRLEPVRLARLTPFLAHVEQAPEGIFIERITIRSPRNDPGRLRVDVVFVTYV